MKKEVPEECLKCILGYTFKSCLYPEKDRPCTKRLKNMPGTYINTSTQYLENVLKRIRKGKM